MEFFTEYNCGKRNGCSCKTTMKDEASSNSSNNADISKLEKEIEALKEQIKNGGNSSNGNDIHAVAGVTFKDSDGSTGIEITMSNGEKVKTITGYSKEITLKAGIPEVITHNLGTEYLNTSIYNTETKKEVMVPETIIDANNISIVSSKDVTVLVQISR